MVAEPTDVAAALDELYAEMARMQLQGLWQLGDEITATRPKVKAVPYVWRGADIRRVLMQAGELVKHGDAAERRTLRLVNPGIPASHSATHTLAAAVQLLLPGEIAPTHRHTPTAVRFMLRGQGAYTTVAGERCTMRPGDLIMTPRMAWHHHGNEGSEPVIWTDGLDFPLVILLNQTFWEPYGEGRQPETEPTDGSLLRVTGTLRPGWQRPAETRRLLTYRWEDTYAALKNLARLGESSPYDDLLLEYTNPRTGGHVMPAMACFIQLLRPGVETRAHRHTSSAVYHVFRGEGYSIVDGRRYDWAEGDFLALPAWAVHQHVNPTREETILYSISDLPVLEAIDLYREEAVPAGS